MDRTAQCAGAQNPVTMCISLVDARDCTRSKYAAGYLICAGWLNLNYKPGIVGHSLASIISTPTVTNFSAVGADQRLSNVLMQQMSVDCQRSLISLRPRCLNDPRLGRPARYQQCTSPRCRALMPSISVWTSSLSAPLSGTTGSSYCTL